MQWNVVLFVLERGRRGALCLPPTPSVSLSESIEEEKDDVPPQDSSSRRGSSAIKDGDSSKDIDIQDEDKNKVVFEAYEVIQTVLIAFILIRNSLVWGRPSSG